VGVGGYVCMCVCARARARTNRMEWDEKTICGELEKT